MWRVTNLHWILILWTSFHRIKFCLFWFSLKSVWMDITLPLSQTEATKDISAEQARHKPSIRYLPWQNSFVSCNKTVYWESLLQNQLYLRRSHAKQTQQEPELCKGQIWWGSTRAVIHLTWCLNEQSFSTPRFGTSRIINYTTPFAMHKGSLESWLRCRCLHHKCLNLDRQLSPTSVSWSHRN